MSVNQILLVPTYMDRFQCIGSACEDTCCAGWSVPIDRATYQKYKKLSQSDLTQKLDTHIKRKQTNPTEGHYATIKMSGCQSCPMLTADSLCEIQLRLGEEYLSKTCANYPRVTNRVNGNYEMAATMSCPEAARLALLNPEPMSFFEIPSQPGQTFSIQTELHPANCSPAELPFYFWDLRIFSIELIQNRRYSLTDRVLILGLFYQNMDDFVNSGKVAEIPRLIENYRTLIKDGSLEAAIQQIPPEAAAQIRLLKELIDVRMHIGIDNQRYLDSFQAFLAGISFDNEEGIETVAARYQAAYTDYYKPFMNTYSYVLENYLVNYMYKNTFPFSSNAPVLENYFLLALHYSLIKMHLIGIAGFYKDKLAVEHVITLIQSFAKVVEHNSRYMQIAFDYLKRRDFVSIAGMAIFLKNE
ncbi:flagellin lysine-N-methylase [Brevibacillus sp. TJ4]|uniref:flagellin lysine-N-methylase n=1 Tax=Brevibacillus sp. TJ4 TaxID=3234853 RepID=UPI0037CCFBE1